MTSDPTPAYTDVVYLQGEEADMVLDMIDTDPDEAAAYLSEWDFGDETTGASAYLNKGRADDDPPWGGDDQTREVAIGGLTYVLAWHPGLRYVSLTRGNRADTAPAETTDLPDAGSVVSAGATIVRAHMSRGKDGTPHVVRVHVRVKPQR